MEARPPNLPPPPRDAPRPPSAGPAALVDAAPPEGARSFDAARRTLLDAVAVVPHTDADGLAAGAIALRARGEGAAAAILLGRGETPFDDDAPLPVGPLAILDWGIRPLDRPALLVDHHAADGSVLLDRRYPTAIQDALVVWDPEAPTAALMRRVVPEAPAWLAAVGAVGDAGDAGFALPRIAELQEAKAAWRAEFDRVVRTAPRVGDRVAVLRFTSPAQVHPLVAQTWSRRLKPRVVLAANDDYLPGRVNFAVRGGRDGEDLRALLSDAGLDPVHGHARATGGSLEPPAFERLQEALLSA